MADACAAYSLLIREYLNLCAIELLSSGAFHLLHGSWMHFGFATWLLPL